MSPLADTTINTTDNNAHNDSDVFPLLKNNFGSNHTNSLQEWCTKIQQFELLQLIKKNLKINHCMLSLVFSCDENNPFDYSYFKNVHAKHKQPSLIIFQTNEGEIFGGFTSKPWLLETSNSADVRDRNAFLFSVDRKDTQPNTSNELYESAENVNVQIYGLAHFQDKTALTILEDNQYGGIMFGRDTLFICNDCTNSGKDSCSMYIDSKNTTYLRGNDDIELDNFYITRLAFYHIK